MLRVFLNRFLEFGLRSKHMNSSRAKAALLVIDSAKHLRRSDIYQLVLKIYKCNIDLAGISASINVVL